MSPPSKMAMSSAKRGDAGALTLESDESTIGGGPSLPSVSLIGMAWNWPAAIRFATEPVSMRMEGAATVSATVPKKFDLTSLTQSLKGVGRILAWLYVVIKSTVLCCVVELVDGACVS